MRGEEGGGDLGGEGEGIDMVGRYQGWVAAAVARVVERVLGDGAKRLSIWC